MVQLRNRYIPSPDVRAARRGRRRRPASRWNWLAQVGFSSIPALIAYAKTQNWFRNDGSKGPVKGPGVIRPPIGPKRPPGDRPAPSNPESVQKPKRPKKVDFSLDRGFGKMGYDAQRIIRGGKRIRKQDPYRAAIKIEKGINVNGMNAVYVGGTTHPCQATTSQVFQALIRFLFVKERIDFPSFDSKIAEGLDTQYRIEFYYRYDTRSPIALTKATVDSTIGWTYSQFTSAVIDKFIDIFGAPPVNAGPPTRANACARLIYLTFASRDAALPIYTFCRFYKADELFISVKGESSIQVQNRTKADVAGVDDANTDSIYANPLRGKYYKFSKARPMLKAPGPVTSAKYTYFFYDANCGLIRTQDSTTTTDSDFSDEVRNALKKPPTGNMFSSCVAQKYITCKPGEIIRSYVSETVTKSLSSWIFAFFPKWFQASIKTYSDMVTLEDPASWTIGNSHCYGLEKMVDTNPQAIDKYVTVGIEHNLYVVAKCVYKPKMGCVAQVNIVT